MERLRSIPQDVEKFNPAYKGLRFWLEKEGILPSQAAEVARSSYRFQVAILRIYGEGASVRITGKHQEGTAPSLHYSIEEIEGIEVQPEAERAFQEAFEGGITSPLTEILHIELRIVPDIVRDPEIKVNDHIGYIGFTEQSRRLGDRLIASLFE